MSKVGTWKTQLDYNFLEDEWGNHCLIEMVDHRRTIYQPLRSGRIWHKVNF